MATSETITLMATLLGNRRVAESAVSYLATCRAIPEPEQIAAALKVPMLTARKIAAAAGMSTKFVFGTMMMPVSNPDIVAWRLSDLKDKTVENLVVLTVTSENTLIGRHLVATGSAGGVCVNYGEVYRYAIEDQATGIIVAHNHPSGSLEFSGKDASFTKGLIDSGKLLGIRMLDSMVVSRQGFASMRRMHPEIFAENEQ